MQQQRLIERSAVGEMSFIVWDVGLGAAANALAAIEALRHGTAPVEIHSFDRTTAPLEFAISHAGDLHYLLGFEKTLRGLIDRGEADVTPYLRWFLHRGEFADQLKAPHLPRPNAIFYDPYSPSVNVDMWTLDHFRSLRARLGDDVPCLLTNYTCSTAVRVTLLLAGFYVGVGCGVGEKVETTLAANQLGLLSRPLNRDWLRRVRVSHSAAPVRGSEFIRTAIDDDDFARLRDLPQFQGA